jgi:hypothetical protein
LAHHDDAMAVLRLTGAGRLRLRDLIEEIHKPEEAPDVYKRLVGSKTFPVVQFDWSDKE